MHYGPNFTRQRHNDRGSTPEESAKKNDWGISLKFNFNIKETFLCCAIVLVLSSDFFGPRFAIAENNWRLNCHYSTYSYTQLEAPAGFKSDFHDPDYQRPLPQVPGLEMLVEIPAFIQERALNFLFPEFMSRATKALLEQVPGARSMVPVSPEHPADIEFSFLAMESTFFNSTPWASAYINSSLPSSDTFRVLNSPWLHATQTFDGQHCQLKIFVFWNERQFVADQANLNGVKPPLQGTIVPNGAKEALLPYQFRDAVVFHKLPNLTSPESTAFERKLKELPDEHTKQKFIRQFIANQYPPDLLWLFSLPRAMPADDADIFMAELHHIHEELVRFNFQHFPSYTSHVLRRFLISESNQLTINNVIDVNSAEGGDGLKITGFKIQDFIFN